MKWKTILRAGWIALFFVMCCGCGSGREKPSFSAGGESTGAQSVSTEESESQPEQSEATEQSGEETFAEFPLETQSLPDSEQDSLAFSALYCPTNETGSGACEYPSVIVISSEEAWREYYEQNQSRYQFGRSIGDSPSFEELVQSEQYSEEFFKDNNLVLVVAQASSGSARYEVTGISENGEIHIAVHMPSIGTADMAQWHIVIEVSKDGPQQYTTNLLSNETDQQSRRKRTT